LDFSWTSPYFRVPFPLKLDGLFFVAELSENVLRVCIELFSLEKLEKAVSTTLLSHKLSVHDFLYKKHEALSVLDFATVSTNFQDVDFHGSLLPLFIN